LLSAFKNKLLSPFSKLPTVILKKEASILALSLATFSLLASLIWEEALKTPEQIDDREILLAFQAHANLSFSEFMTFVLPRPLPVLLTL